MRLLLWQWGRFGGPPHFASLLAEALRARPDVDLVLSLSSQAEILLGADPPKVDLPVRTYSGPAGFVLRALTAPAFVWRLTRRLRPLRLDLALCSHPGPLDLLMAAALRLLRVPLVVIVHDADRHPGDGFPLLMWLQHRLCHAAVAVGALSSHVADSLQRQGLAGTPHRKLIRLLHPPIGFAVPPLRQPDGMTRLLFFGRLLPYKGIDLLAEAVDRLGPRRDLAIRIVGSGPDSAALHRLRAAPNVVVENRWVPDAEIGSVLGWADALVLPYREASQSGVAAAALAAGRVVVATRVGGLAEQLAGAGRAILCAPTAEGLADGLCRLLDDPLPAAEAADPGAAWGEMAATLLQQVRPLLPAGAGKG